MPFRPEYSESIIGELARLDCGNAIEKKRAQTARSKIPAVCHAPYSSTYSKDLPEHYGAVAVTGRFRIFFKIHPEYEVVFFAWMNDESHIHASGTANDAYNEFRRKLNNGEIEAYEHIEPLGEQFIFNGAWGNGYIYIEFNRAMSNQFNEYARSSLTLNQMGQREYAIDSIDVSDENKGLASELLRRTMLRADEDGIQLSYDLFLTSANLDKSRYLLSKFGFTLSASDSEIELWNRSPQSR